MRLARLVPIAAALAAAGCFPPDRPDAPEEEALDRVETAEELFRQGRFDEAAPHYEFAVKSRWRWKDPYVKLAKCREAAGRDDEAIQILGRLLEVDRSDETGLRELGRLCAARGKTEEAIGYYRRLRAVRPDPALDGEIARLEAMRKN